MKVSIQIFILLCCICLSLAIHFRNQTTLSPQLSLLDQSFEVDSTTILFVNGISTENVIFNQKFAAQFPEEASAAALLFNLNEPHLLTYRIEKMVVIPSSFSTPQFSHIVLISKTFDRSVSWLYVSVFDDRSHFGYYDFKLGRFSPNAEINLSFHLDKTATISYQDDKHRVISRKILIPANGMITQE